MRSIHPIRRSGLVVPGRASNLKSERLSTIEAVNAACRADFLSFTRKCFEISSPGTSFQANWHIYALAYRLEQVRLGKIRRLISRDL